MVILISLSAIADKLKLPYPILLVSVGLFIGFVPFLPDLALDPDIVFLMFLPPLLYDAASKTSWQDFKTSIKPISALAITLVFFTATAVAVAAHYVIPGFSWPLSFLLGAIVSPPDAVAATSIIKNLGLNKKILTILEGESLVNDASALIAYRYALAAVSTGAFIFWQAGLQFLYVAGGGIIVGLLIGQVFVLIHKQIKHNSLVETSLSLLTPFVSYLSAEHVHTSGVLAVVSAGLLVSRHATEVFTYQTRMRNRAVWDTLIFLLNGFVFILIGLQLPAILKGLVAYTPAELIGYGAMISAVTIAIRIAWVFSGAYYPLLFTTKKLASGLPAAQEEPEIAWKNVMIIAWVGTRGVVSLATAMALPLTLQDGSAFPQRGIILFLGFVVIFVTLVVQGVSLPLLIRLLGVKPKEDTDQESKELLLVIVTSVIHFIEQDFPGPLDDKLKGQMKSRYEQIADQLSREIIHLKKSGNEEGPLLFSPLSQLLSAQREIARFQRHLLIKLHKEGRFSDTAIRKIERELDVEEMRLNVLVEKAKE
ncbi:Na+/H+ antiporter [Paraflavisolibacter sp. H34]|uniref:Na+/H+ antiporter n=1 Tax=Huijunlia imazamoxiresistens TaxID=3127457 RepID=UPI00301B0C32